MAMDDVMNASFGPWATAVFLDWAELIFKLAAMACGMLVLLAVYERARMWTDAARRLWLEAAPEEGGPARGPSTLNAKALAKTVGLDLEGTDMDDFLVAITLPRAFEEESRKTLRDARERLERFKQAPENRSRLKDARGVRLLYLVSQAVLTIAGCILLMAFFWADFAWREASSLSVDQAGPDLGWGDHVALKERERAMAKKPPALNERR
jgi:hypothetical protein